MATKTTRTQPECPECQKLANISKESNMIGDFLDWLSSEGTILATYHDDELYPLRISISDLLAKYYGIDLDKVEKERRELLKWIQEVNA